jgi:hypothetical protein
VPSLGEDCLNCSQSETRIDHVYQDFCPIGMETGNRIEDLPQMLHTKLRLNWASSLRGVDF